MTEAEIRKFVSDVEDYLCAVASEPQYAWFRLLAWKRVRGE